MPQMRQAYANVQRLLAEYGTTMANIVDEVLFVTDMEMAYTAAVKCRRTIFTGTPIVASTIVQIQRLAFPELMIEIKCVASIEFHGEALFIRELPQERRA